MKRNEVVKMCNSTNDILNKSLDEYSTNLSKDHSEVENNRKNIDSYWYGERNNVDSFGFEKRSILNSYSLGYDNLMNDSVFKSSLWRQNNLTFAIEKINNIESTVCQLCSELKNLIIFGD